jgi:hypothetical protein
MSGGFGPGFWSGIPKIPVKDMCIPGVVCHLFEYDECSNIHDKIGRELYDRYAKIRTKEWDALFYINRSTGINIHAEVIDRVYEEFYK